jgi:hypothetical protein
VSKQSPKEIGGTWDGFLIVLSDATFSTESLISESKTNTEESTMNLRKESYIVKLSVKLGY